VYPARRLAPDRLAAWQQVLERGYEGLVAKDEASPYVGGRTLSWLKVKQRDYRAGARGFQSGSRSRREGERPGPVSPSEYMPVTPVTPARAMQVR